LSARPLRGLVSFLPFGPRPAAHDDPLSAVVGFYAHGVAPRRLC
jgi:hypothetical protein